MYARGDMLRLMVDASTVVDASRESWNNEPALSGLDRGY